jgi:hypothetical protein
MRAEPATEIVTPPAPGLDAVGAPARTGRPPFRPRLARLDRYELAVLIAFALVSCWVLALDLHYASASGLRWTGTDGLFITDQMQYLGWIRSASQHFLISDMFVLRHTPADYFQPAIVVSAALTLLGVPIWLALLLWKPAAVLASFFAARAVAHRTLSRPWQRRAALALALFYGSFTHIFGQVTVIGDLFPGALAWGYPFALLALAVMAYALVLYDRARAADRITLWPALLGAFAGLLHPWNDEAFVLVVLGAELAALRGGLPGRRRLALAALTVAGAATSLLYFLALDKLDPTWAMARQGSRHVWPFWPTVLVVAPLAPLALLGSRGTLRSFWLNAMRSWPVVCVVVFWFSESGQSATPLHAFQGITFPLAVLAVRGACTTDWRALRSPLARRLRRPRRLRAGPVLAAVALAAACVPATADELRTAPQFMRPIPGNGNYIRGGERRALSYLASDPTRGGVLTRFYLGVLVPGFTGRLSYDGTCLWSEPGCRRRGMLAAQLFTGKLDAARARAFVAGTGARFVLADCRTTVNLGRLLGGLVVSARRFGCAGVYQVRPTASGSRVAAVP